MLSTASGLFSVGEAAALLAAALFAGCAPEARSVCQQACQKAIACGLTSATQSDCEIEHRCDTLDNNPDGCRNQGDIVGQVNDCIGTSCDQLTACLDKVPACAR